MRAFRRYWSVAFTAAAITGCASSGAHHEHAMEAAPATAATATASPSHDMSGHSMAGHDMGGSKAAETAFLFPDGDDKGWSKIENGMQHAMAPDVPLSLLPASTRAELLRQLALTMDVIKLYPTVKDAVAAGYRRAGPFLPGLGTHFVGGRTNGAGPMTDVEILHPSTIIYTGNSPDAPIAGFMYVSIAAGKDKEPEGFAGPNDHWHYHVGVCLVRGENGAQEALGFDGSITAESCRTKGGNYMPITQYMLHVWTVPGFSSPLGVFSHTNPALTCADGTYYTDNTDITNSCKAK